MEWMALACTADNIVLASHRNLPIIQSACAGEFRAICKIYGVDKLYVDQLGQKNFDFKLQFISAAETTFIPHKKTNSVKLLSDLLRAKVSLIVELEERLAHGYKRFSSVVEWQEIAYKEKYEQALRIINRQAGETGMVLDYADEAGIDTITAASLIVVKNQNQTLLIRKLERLRIRHQIAIRKAATLQDIMNIRDAIKEDSFLSMMM